MLDVFEGRQRADLVACFNVRPPHWVSGVKVVDADLHEPFRAAFDECLPAAVQVADPMHVVMAANRCPDKTRRRIQNEQLAHRGRKDDPLFGARKLLMLGAERLDPRSRKRLDVLLAFGDHPVCQRGVRPVWLLSVSGRDRSFCCDFAFCC